MQLFLEIFKEVADKATKHRNEDTDFIVGFMWKFVFHPLTMSGAAERLARSTTADNVDEGDGIRAIEFSRKSSDRSGEGDQDDTTSHTVPSFSMSLATRPPGSTLPGSSNQGSQRLSCGSLASGAVKEQRLRPKPYELRRSLLLARTRSQASQYQLSQAISGEDNQEYTIPDTDPSFSMGAHEIT